jgi:predicted metal-binding membrane protein
MTNLNELLSQVTERRQNLLQKTVSTRTRHFCLVLEDFLTRIISSAVIRTAEVFGLQMFTSLKQTTLIKCNNPF